MRRAFFKVMVLTHHPITLFAPRIAYRVLRSSRTARLEQLARGGVRMSNAVTGSLRG